jgi:CRISPR-associated protein Cas2
MLIITYDISNDKLRTKFWKFLKKYWRRIQYSVFEIKNSQRILGLITTQIKEIFEPKFTWADSILIIPISDADMKKVLRYWQPVMEEEELLFL